MNFCSDCGTDLRAAPRTAFCPNCGRALGGNVATTDELKLPPLSEPSVSEGDLANNLRSLVYDLATRFSFKTTPQHVSDFHRCPPIEVMEDTDFETFEDGSVDESSTSVIFPCMFPGVPDAQLYYLFKRKEYSFYDGDDVYVNGLSSIFINGVQLKKSWIQEVFGKQHETMVLDNFTSVSKWRLPTPKSGGRFPEEFIATFAPKNPDDSSSLWINFPEHT